jgi:hypothetical protein
MITTRQQLVNAVAERMGRQGWRVARLGGKGGACYYRKPGTSDGCGIGCLMLDGCPTLVQNYGSSIYSSHEYGLAGIPKQRQLLIDAGIDEAIRNDARELQWRHDEAEGDTWRESFMSLVTDWGCALPEGV